MELDQDQVISADDVQVSVHMVRRSLQDLIDIGYEAFEVERGQERIHWLQGFRLHSFIVLKLRRGASLNVKYARIEWGSWGLKWSGVVNYEDDIQNCGGVFYPMLRTYMPIGNPASALESLDSLVLKPMQDTGRQYSLEVFNCCHFSNQVEEILLAQSVEGPPGICTKSFSKEEETNMNIYDRYLDVSNEIDSNSDLAAMIAQQVN